MPRNPDRELDGTNTEDFPTGTTWTWSVAEQRYIPRERYEPGAFGKSEAWWESALHHAYDHVQPRRIANVRRTADAVRAFLRFLGLLALVMGLIFGLLLAADRLLPSTTRPTTTASEGPG